MHIHAQMHAQLFKGKCVRACLSMKISLYADMGVLVATVVVVELFAVVVVVVELMTVVVIDVVVVVVVV